MQKIHEAGETVYDKTKAWINCAYGWHNSLFPPEYRHCCLSGKVFQAEPSCDLYYVMTRYYENLTGHKAPYNFEIDRMWRGRVAMSVGRKELKAVTEMIAECTRWQGKRRIQSAEELLKRDFIKVITT